jgi:hypothetical protein
MFAELKWKVNLLPTLSHHLCEMINYAPNADRAELHYFWWEKLKTANCFSLKINPSASEIWPRNELCCSSRPEIEFITLEPVVMEFLTGEKLNHLDLARGAECMPICSIPFLGPQEAGHCLWRELAPLSGSSWFQRAKMLPLCPKMDGLRQGSETKHHVKSGFWTFHKRLKCKECRL